ncbi:hypothetical protein ZEAMMB73_Zm00001d000228 [Zea mays]|nr:hypothetical protein ZEAMMB73_Zm00001d000228 [Zea mays]
MLVSYSLVVITFATMNSTYCFSRCVERHVYSSYDEFLRLHEVTHVLRILTVYINNSFYFNCLQNFFGPSNEFHASRSQDSRRPKIVYQFVLVFLFVGMPDSNELMFNTEQPTYNFGAYKISKLKKERRAQLDSIHVKSKAAAKFAHAIWCLSQCTYTQLENFNHTATRFIKGLLSGKTNLWAQTKCDSESHFASSLRSVNLVSNQAKKTDINCDATLKSLFGGRDKVGMLEISKLLSRGFPKISKLLWSMEPGMALW